MGGGNVTSSQKLVCYPNILQLTKLRNLCLRFLIKYVIANDKKLKLFMFIELTKLEVIIVPFKDYINKKLKNGKGVKLQNKEINCSLEQNYWNRKVKNLWK